MKLIWYYKCYYYFIIYINLIKIKMFRLLKKIERLVIRDLRYVLRPAHTMHGPWAWCRNTAGGVLVMLQSRTTQATQTQIWLMHLLLFFRHHKHRVRLRSPNGIHSYRVQATCSSTLHWLYSKDVRAAFQNYYALPCFRLELVQLHV